MSIIEVKNLKKVYSIRKKEPGLLAAIKGIFQSNIVYHTALDNVSFNVSEGEILGLLGPNGAGKTTLLKLLSGLLHPSEGVANVLGFRPWDQKNQFKKNISMITGQKNQLWWDLSAYDSFLWLKDIYEIPDEIFKNNIEEFVEMLDIKNFLNKQIRTLSLGQRMKMEITAALLHNPKVIYLDEPTIGLDILSQRKIRDFIKKLKRKGNITVIITSHQMSDIEETCDRVIVLHEGKKFFDGKLNYLVQKFSKLKFINLTLTEGEILDKNFNENVKIKHIGDMDYLLQVPKELVQETVMKIWNNYSVFDMNMQDIEASYVIEELFKKANNSVK